MKCAVALVNKLLVSSPMAQPSVNNEEQFCTSVVECPHDLLGLLIGRNGWTLKKIISESGANITINNNALFPTQPRRIIIYGLPHHVKIAENYVNRIIYKQKDESRTAGLRPKDNFAEFISNVDMKQMKAYAYALNDIPPVTMNPGMAMPEYHNPPPAAAAQHASHAQYHQHQQYHHQAQQHSQHQNHYNPNPNPNPHYDPRYKHGLQGSSPPQQSAMYGAGMGLGLDRYSTAAGGRNPRDGMYGSGSLMGLGGPGGGMGMGVGSPPGFAGYSGLYNDNSFGYLHK